MDPEELLKLLDLKGAAPAAPPGPGPPLVVSGAAPPGAAPASPTALEVDAWGLRRGRDLLEASARIGRLGLDAWAVADCHAAAFDPDPRLLPACREPGRREFFAALLETPDYRALHAGTRLDPVAAEIAAAHFAEALARAQQEGPARGAADTAAGEIAALKAAARAAAAAREEVTECREAAAALGLGAGSPGANDARAIADLFRRVRDDPALRRICTLAGRYRRLAQSRQRRKTRHGLDDVVGVELGGDLGRVLPHELARLAVPALEAEALRRLAERQLMCREHRASEPVALGPVVVCVDESGSMEGEPAHAAKALALALAWVARRQRRWCALVAYSGDSGERLLALPPGRWDERALAAWLTAFLGCGSTLDVPVRELPRMFEALRAPAGATDVVFLTDCQCRIPEDVRAAFLAWKASARARLFTLVLGTEAGDLAGVSDEIHLVRALDVGEPAVGRALSL